VVKNNGDTPQPWTVARLIAKAFLAPLVLGMLLRAPFSAAAERLSERLLAIAGAVLSAAGLALLALHGHLLLEAGFGPPAALLLMTFVALLTGHLMGGPDPDDRAALAVCCASRHVGIATLAAAAVPGPRIAALVLAYVLAAAIASAVYLRWQSSVRATSS
jgi:BASS family bile acid:Na+ symporter